MTRALAAVLVLSSCARATPVSEKVAAVASAKYAQTLASARAAEEGIIPLGERAALPETSFVPEPPRGCAFTPSDACGLDLIDDEPVPDSVVLPRRVPVRLIGWAADGMTRTVPPVVALELAGDTTYAAPAARFTRRPDVARALKTPAFATSGYDLMALLRAVEPGRYRLRVVQVTARGEGLVCDTRRTLVVE